MPEQYPLYFEFRANQTFDDFYAGANQSIIDDLKRCILGNGEQQIFVWAKTGQGKSHLLQSCCHYAQHYDIQSFYFDLARFNRHNAAIFLDLEDYEVVCIDNVDWIIGQPKWEQALSFFMQRHYERGHRLILSATNLPNHLTFKISDVKASLSWGLMVHLKTLVNTNSIDALIFRADAMGIEISPQVGRFIMIQHQNELDKLWHLLAKLDRATLAAKRRLTIPFLKQLLSGS